MTLHEIVFEHLLSAPFGVDPGAATLRLADGGAARLFALPALPGGKTLFIQHLQF